MPDTHSLTATLVGAVSTRLDRARLRGVSRKPVTPEFEARILREGVRGVLHAGAVSRLVSTSFLEALFMTTTHPGLLRVIPRNSRAPLWVIGQGLHCDFDEVELVFYARRMGRPDLAMDLLDEVEDRTITLEARWRKLGGGDVPPDEPRLPCGRTSASGTPSTAPTEPFS
ncbi:hypothetical protein [Agrococcus jenensis]|uniref:Uncharacterized protein n=1 Tax=Agrococcus jenensis TaxID=46353 RepID=A0A3N2AT78_9MICO|nr:hypothetical protein [Agrococcus jenensis]ROR66234.1 hypothetical protein EDD26_1616 [Agrococcus jenensis]